MCKDGNAMDKNSTKDIANLAYSFTNGDYVMYKGKMDRIDAHMGGKVHLERLQDSVWIDDIKPVKLSFELLEKIGFEHNKERWFELIFEHSKNCRFRLFYIGCCMLVFNKENKASFVGEVKYLHKLQQLLRTMDINFEIIV